MFIIRSIDIFHVVFIGCYCLSSSILRLNHHMICFNPLKQIRKPQFHISLDFPFQIFSSSSSLLSTAAMGPIQFNSKKQRNVMVLDSPSRRRFTILNFPKTARIWGRIRWQGFCLLNSETENLWYETWTYDLLFTLDSVTV